MEHINDLTRSGDVTIASTLNAIEYPFFDYEPDYSSYIISIKRDRSYLGHCKLDVIAVPQHLDEGGLGLAGLGILNSLVCTGVHEHVDHEVVAGGIDHALADAGPQVAALVAPLEFNGNADAIGLQHHVRSVLGAHEQHVVHCGVDVTLPLQPLLDLGLGLLFAPMRPHGHFTLYQPIHQVGIDELLDLIFAFVAVVNGTENVFMCDGLGDQSDQLGAAFALRGGLDLCKCFHAGYMSWSGLV